jgi:hypothetical protein
MDNELLRNLAEEIQDVIEKYDVDFEMFAINITVTQDYFEAVKGKFHSKSPVPTSQMFTEVDEKWAINLVRPLEIGKKGNK